MRTMRLVRYEGFFIRVPTPTTAPSRRPAVVGNEGHSPQHPFLCTSPGFAARVLFSSPVLPRSVRLFFLVVAGLVVCLRLSLFLSVSVSLFVCLSLFLRPVCVRLRVYHLFLGGWFFSPTIVPAAPSRTMRLV